MDRELKRIHELLSYHSDRNIFVYDLESGTIRTTPKAAAGLDIEPELPDFLNLGGDLRNKKCVDLIKLRHNHREGLFQLFGGLHEKLPFPN